MGGKDGSPGGGYFPWYGPILMLVHMGGPLVAAACFFDRYEQTLGAWCALAVPVIWLGGTVGGIFIADCIRERCRK